MAPKNFSTFSRFFGSYNSLHDWCGNNCCNRKSPFQNKVALTDCYENYLKTEKIFKSYKTLFDRT